jgi:hypothetical protein
MTARSLVLAMAMLATNAAACLPEGGVSSRPDCWVIEVPDSGTPPAALPATVGAIAGAASGRNRSRIEIRGYVESTGSTALGLARVQGVADTVRRTLLQSLGKWRPPIDSTLLVATGSDRNSSRAGRLVIRIRYRFGAAAASP